MKNFLKNNFDDITISENKQIIEKFSNSDWEKHIFLDPWSDLIYLIILDNSNINLNIVTRWENCKIKLFWIFFSSDKKEINSNIITDLNHSNTQANNYLLSFVWNHGKIQVNWSINIKPWCKNVKWHLLEENLILGENISIKTLPILNVHSNDVQASHGAKIDKVNSDKLFYMTSKWIDKSTSKKLIIDGYINNILQYFTQFDQEEIRKLINI